MKTTSAKTAIIIYTVLFVISVSRQFVQCSNASFAQTQKNAAEEENVTTCIAKKLPEQGNQTFHFETFSGETYWTGALQLKNAIAGEKKPALAQGYLSKPFKMQE